MCVLVRAHSAVRMRFSFFCTSRVRSFLRVPHVDSIALRKLCLKSSDSSVDCNSNDSFSAVDFFFSSWIIAAGESI